jgi:hypothetical protein
MKRQRQILIAMLLIISLAFPLLLSADWQTPINMGPVINGSQEDYSPFIIREGTSLYYARGPVTNRDIYVSVYQNGQWQPPVSMGWNVNSSYDDRDPTVIGDTMIIFASDRPSPYTGWPFHLWYTKPTDGIWDSARVVEAPVSSNYGEETPWMIWEGSDTLLLFFCSLSRSGGLGGWDIWQARKISGVWQTPTNIGSPVNTSGLESSPNIWVSPTLLGLDSIRMYYVTNFGGYYADRVDGVWRNPVRLTDIINSGGIDRPSISFDNQTLYFSSSRPGGYGQRDIWYSTYSSGVETEAQRLSSSPDFRLAALPNPFQARSVIMFSLDREEAVGLDIYGLDGRRVRSLRSGKTAPGVHRFAWDGSGQAGSRVGPGVYFVRLRTPFRSATIRILKLD